ncbi:MAG: hypothetical protein OXE76_14105 [Alphaproteobacteria bacterium]|nr:hypothetical protein [Alphaproteobacteria bacterium]MCY4320285.1 hypothetical protein [Alphaproteobacteria bacterium]
MRSARYEQHVAKLDNHSGFIDLFWPGVLFVEQKSAGCDLGKAYEQAREYFDALPERERPRYILGSDFQTFELHTLDERENVTFPLANLPANIDKFGFIRRSSRRITSPTRTIWRYSKCPLSTGSTSRWRSSHQPWLRRTSSRIVPGALPLYFGILTSSLLQN